ncbi:MAG: PfkB family carbohydrate kinase [Methanobrevibacter sp.]|nr:PfkB family carbohydrate kinase [Methanobrevibacter sp.]
MSTLDNKINNNQDYNNNKDNKYKKNNEQDNKNNRDNNIKNNSIQADVIGFGALNLDKLFYVNDIAHEDEESFIKDLDQNPGGSASNTIIGLSRLGLSVSYIGKIANDEEGEFLKKNLILEGVLTNNLIVAKNGCSGKVLGFINENGERALYVDSGVNDEIAIDEINIDQIKNAKIIHYTSFVGNSFQTQNNLLEFLPESIILSFDPGHIYAKKKISSLKKILNRTNILLINEKELKLLFEDYYLRKNKFKSKSLNYREIAINILNDGIENIIVKRGEKGVYAINNKNEEVKIPAYNCEVIDTTAAGDSFNAGFLFSYLNDYSLKKSCMIGNWAASKCIENIGIKGLPVKNELKKFENSIK